MYYDINKLRAALKTYNIYLQTGDASKRAYLRGADLSGADLSGAKLSDADLRSAEARHG